ncbi:hypothetical protein PoB_000276800 [Plakobranchus ocellatus]|uniref:Uncharacterized protein n=1 Tax=Plakobranchus ocellatus TaxID=259542 RepID=A0AAV3Y0U5_9GAST|nr:hypothetical protein PoB_000276800 [Plakobranchus ocellatus]
MPVATSDKEHANIKEILLIRGTFLSRQKFSSSLISFYIIFLLPLHILIRLVFFFRYCESALRSSVTALSRVRATPPALRPDGGPET